MRQADDAAAKVKQQTTQAVAIDPPGDSDGSVVKVAAVDPSQLNFSYKIEGPNVPWRPVRVFDDRSHVYLEMPASMKSSQAPALLIARGGWDPDGQLPSAWKLFRGRSAVREGRAAGRGRAAAGSRGNRVRGRKRGRGDGADQRSRRIEAGGPTLADEEHGAGGGGRGSTAGC